MTRVRGLGSYLDACSMHCVLIPHREGMTRQTGKELKYAQIQISIRVLIPHREGMTESGDGVTTESGEF